MVVIGFDAVLVRSVGAPAITHGYLLTSTAIKRIFSAVMSRLNARYSQLIKVMRSDEKSIHQLTVSGLAISSVITKLRLVFGLNG